MSDRRLPTPRVTTKASRWPKWDDWLAGLLGVLLMWMTYVIVGVLQ